MLNRIGHAAWNAGLMHLDTGRRTPRVVDKLRDGGRMAFKVLPKPNPLRLAEPH